MTRPAYPQARAAAGPAPAVTDPNEGFGKFAGLAMLATAVAAVLGATVGAGAAFGVVGGILGLIIFVAAAKTPIFATYAYIGTMPIISGIDRDELIPLVRPNEALLALVMAGAITGAYLRMLRGDSIRPRFYGPVDAPLGIFLLMATVWPVATMLLRDLPPAGEDYASTLPMVKLVGIYFLVRYTVHTEQETVRLIRFIVWPGATVALVAVLQTLKFGPMLALLNTFWASAEGASELEGLGDRGSATLGSPIAAGDVIIISLIIVLCCGARGLLGRRERLVLALLLGTGVFAAGQFSTWIAALVGFALIAWRFPEMRRQATRFAPLGLVALVIGFPAFVGRLEGIGEYGGWVPESWLGRYDNLAHLFIPHFNWVTIWTGVRVNPVLHAPERWRDLTYLESGILWFVWIGGIPLLLAFLWLSYRVLRTVRPAIRHPGAFGACASSLEIVWLFLLVLTLIDPHLQLRGTGDLLFTLLAITVGGIDARRRT
ncbi:hypothetical protein GCM10023321_30520 [Pseudonocardia eucalypti]|uniref:Uncharacterized protein n=1 Tax=Pseudonocardia eucalypti TaxID=648755 RepID=A0ABP9Q971_9PSEU|nr:hypothetical protein [Pseudonocardia eucalypti]